MVVVEVGTSGSLEGASIRIIVVLMTIDMEG